MQKKFLRTSILTLVMGLSLLTASHAMDPDPESQSPNLRTINARIKTYQYESTKCQTRLALLQLTGADAKTGGYRGQSFIGPITGLFHDREKSKHGGWKSSLTGIHVPGCLACETLDSTVSAMVRDQKVYDARDFQ